MFAKRSKCQFGQSKVEYLGHIISDKGVATDLEKVECMQNWPKPHNVKQLIGFLGLTGYYRKFVKGYVLLSKPLSYLLKEDDFKWNPEADEAFQKLKIAMITVPVLSLPDFTKRFVVKTDASGKGIRAVLIQDGKPLAYMGKALCPRNQSLSIYEREFLAVLMAIQKWKALLTRAKIHY